MHYACPICERAFDYILTLPEKVADTEITKAADVNIAIVNGCASVVNGCT